MRQVCAVVLTVFLSPTALADCGSSWIGIGGAVLGGEVSNSERRELERLLGTPVDEVACSEMRRVRPRVGSFAVTRGFFVLTAGQAVFVSDRKIQEVLFRTDFAAVREAYRTVFVFPVVPDSSARRVPTAVFLDVATDAGRFRFELECTLIARRVVDEFERRTPVKVLASTPPGVAEPSCA
jgi:hypothetical protein